LGALCNQGRGIPSPNLMSLQFTVRVGILLALQRNIFLTAPFSAFTKAFLGARSLKEWFLKGEISDFLFSICVRCTFHRRGDCALIQILRGSKLYIIQVIRLASLTSGAVINQRMRPASAAFGALKNILTNKTLVSKSKEASM
jgi:hypothetical protein